ncbi:MAG: hypothetical protein Ct9H300mP1_28490 [Planctomycetaceae bacterium]|nr:MAG: hypothetical protein Ct9H300mP1_28490 [Planctomycetaceae bacterium]
MPGTASWPTTGLPEKTVGHRSRGELDPGCTANHIGRNHYMSANGLVGVDFTDDPGSVVSDRSVTTGRGRHRWSLATGGFPVQQPPVVSGDDHPGQGRDPERRPGTGRRLETLWHASGSQRSRERAHGGSHALKVTGSGGAGVRQYLSDTSAGQRFRLDGWLFVPKGTVRLIVFDGKKCSTGRRQPARVDEDDDVVFGRRRVKTLHRGPTVGAKRCSFWTT